MSNEFLLNAEIRSDAGKGASRRLRRLQDRVPGILYGGEAEPQMISVELRELKKALENEAFYSHILTLKVDGKDVQAVLRDLQRHPAKGVPTHADFLRVDKTHKITMNVPLHFINEAGSIGVKKQGGEIQHNISEVEVSCLPQDLPEFIEVDMAEVEMNAIVHLSDLKLPKGVELTQLALGDDHDQPVAAIHAPKVRASESDDEEGGEEAASEE
ncbi:MAG: 50S ribosomal protein L25 [Alcanivoracaceae bacterium]|uniref:Large ribosomal subunit protein bL25 n=1 Tax=Alcanivorax profundi TaxID=2338368 RepID=A0A418XVX1_9GAMM|nr:MULTISPECIES: 50S ribosomal protein L25/general stress protein Ctc [Alcanivorax]MAX55237.1 50S ribosomal protein L25 [Alcanivoracaceae bacterium]MEE2868936.1 50S ribosomal protein L25/general stress protein Ctc [Pseudomonadota bacterium]ERP90665.1 50S ribosomal protein L25 [Alcanivorax sp. P2S70]PNE03157.1 50S ribosomal protein L25/general stress protein Ctc [Alcanivorax sp. MD8A]RJG16877.1 50S ribosomal protein L25/general stress protein Ctc [Alcanivorax profundi]|tara:strand:+ start:3701 stop:4342 length:642 start_codon:yes stop_codon:yes gene_type:complete